LARSKNDGRAKGVAAFLAFDKPPLFVGQMLKIAVENVIL
jgi:hypothetical protein